jgi:oxygen-dependent protoporphyrinogen oxidase
MTDQELVATVVHDLDAIVPLGAAPDAAVMARWPRSMPQYEVGHLERVDLIERGLDAIPGVFATGSSYRGVGIADVVRRANETASRVRGHVTGTADDLGVTATEGSETERAMEAR